MAWLVTLATWLVIGCLPSPDFTCEQAGDCEGAGDNPMCEPTGWCSVTDSDCPSGRRYADRAGELSEQCVSAGGCPFDREQVVDLGQTGAVHRSPSLTADNRRLLFVVDGALWSASRSAGAGPWGGAERVTGLAGQSILSGSVDPEGVQFFFSAQLDGDALPNLYRADLIGSTLGDPSQLSVSSDSVAETDPFVDANSLGLLFVADDDDDPATTEVLLARRQNAADEFTLVGPLDGDLSPNQFADRSPRLSATGAVLWFSSDRSGADTDIYSASRMSTDGPFGSPGPYSEFNTAGDDYDFFIDASGREAYWIRDGGGGGLLMQDTRVCAATSSSR